MVVCEMAESVEREAIDMFKVWVRGKIYYNGRLKNANKMARILPLYQGFVRCASQADVRTRPQSERVTSNRPVSPFAIE